MKNSKNKVFGFALKALSVGGLLLGSALASADIPSLPGAYLPAPAGTKIGLLHLQYAEADKLYRNGEQVTDQLDLSLKQAMFRYLHFGQLKGMPTLVEGALPIAEQDIGLSGQSWSGLGDGFVGGVLWPYSDRAAGRHAAVALRARVPTGDHKGEGFGVSNDRWAYNFQTAYIHRLGESKFSLEGVAELELSSDSDKQDIETDPLYQVYANARYDFSRKTSLSFQYRHKWGADQSVAGMSLNDGFDNSSIGVVAATFVTPRFHILGHVQQDVDVDLGPEMTVFHVRLGYLF